MASRSPLRRWKRLFPTFSTIDAAIMASVPAGDEAQYAMVLRRTTRRRTSAGSLTRSWSST
jgi:hypothetical protein